MFANLRIGTRLAALTGLMILLLSTMGLSDITGMGSLLSGLRTVYQDSTVPLGELTHVMDGMHRMRGRLLLAVGEEDPAQRDKLLAEIPGLDAALDQEWKTYTERAASDQEKARAAKFAAGLAAYRSLRGRVIDLLKAGDRDGALKLVHGDGASAFNAVLEIIDGLIDTQIQDAKTEYEQAVDTHDSARLRAILLCAAGTIEK